MSVSREFYNHCGEVFSGRSICQVSSKKHLMSISDSLEKFLEGNNENTTFLKIYLDRYKAAKEKSNSVEIAKIDFELLQKWVSSEQADEVKELGLLLREVMINTVYAWNASKKGCVYPSSIIKKYKDSYLYEEGWLEKLEKLTLSPDLPDNNQATEQPSPKGFFLVQSRVAIAFAQRSMDKELVVNKIIEDIKNLGSDGSKKEILLLPPVGAYFQVADGYKRNSRNCLGYAQALVLQEALKEAINQDEELKKLGLQINVSKNFIQTTEIDSTTSSAFEKLCTKHQFTQNSLKGNICIVVDDDTETGATLRAMADNVMKSGGQCIGAVVSLETPGISSIFADEFICNEFKKLVGDEDYNKYNKLFEGTENDSMSGLRSLTPVQLAILYGMVMDSKENVQDFEQIKSYLGLTDEVLTNYEKMLGKQHFLLQVTELSQKLREEQKLQAGILPFDVFSSEFKKVSVRVCGGQLKPLNLVECGKGV